MHDNSNVTKVSTTTVDANQPESIVREKGQTAIVCNSCFKVKAGENELKAANTKKSKSDESDEAKSNVTSNSLGS